MDLPVEEAVLLCANCDSDKWVVVVQDISDEAFNLTALRCADCSETIETTRRID